MQFLGVERSWVAAHHFATEILPGVERVEQARAAMAVSERISRAVEANGIEYQAMSKSEKRVSGR
jgi:hypothetical protein